MASSAFHPEALLEYAEATTYYLRHGSARVADQFATEVERAVAALQRAPDRWPIKSEPEIRRCLLRGFPYFLYYRWSPVADSVVIYAVMHCSRKPSYWRDRLK